MSVDRTIRKGTPKASPRDKSHERARRRSLECKNFRDTLIRDILETGRRSLNSIYGINVPSVNTGGLGCVELMDQIKRWMGGPDVKKALREASSLGRREREAAKFAFYLMKKALPSPCQCLRKSAVGAWKERQTVAVETDLPEGFFEVVDREVDKVFGDGWDHQYVDLVGSCGIPTSACIEASRKDGGARYAADLDSHLRLVIGEEEFPEFRFRYNEVVSAGKLRPLTITPVAMNALRPLHKLIFQCIERQRWSLVGPPTARKFKSAGFKFKSPILSGDYKSATDCLDLRVSRYILGRILSRAPCVPPGVKDAALRSLNPVVEFRDEKGDLIDEITVKRGQMMGSLLSFPLLCLYNRVCTLFALGNVPMLINGDDLVAETRDPSRWYATLPMLGLQPEPDKSGYSSSRLEINSTPFIIRRGNLVGVPVARIRTLLPRPRIPVSVASEHDEFVRPFNKGSRSIASKIFLATRYNLVRSFLSSGGTLSGCGFRQNHLGDLQRSGLLQTADRLSKVVPGTAFLPGVLFEQAHSVPIFGELPISIRKQNHMKMWGDSIGKEIEPVRSAMQVSQGLCPSDPFRLVKIWWRLFRESGIEPIRAPTYRFSFVGNNRALRHGQLMAKKVFLARLLPENGPIHRDRLLFQFYSRVPPTIRWGFNRALR